MASFSIRTHFKILDYTTSLATLVLLVHLLRLDLSISLSSTPPAPTSSPSTIAIAARWCAYIPRHRIKLTLLIMLINPRCMPSIYVIIRQPLIAFPTDQYLRIPTQRTSSSSNSFISWVWSLRCHCGDLFETLYDTEEWRWRSSEGRKVCNWLNYFMSVG